MRTLSLWSVCVAMATAAVVGCASSSSGLAPAVGTLPAIHRAHSDVCTPSVWASSLSTNSVYGFTAASSPACKTLHGPYAGKVINAPIALAMGLQPQYLYVADLNNDRILVFNRQGTYIKEFKTDTGGVLYQPWGVCVSEKGVVGVGDREYNNNGTPGNVEFFHFNQANNTGPYGTGSGFLESDQYCAFDDLGNFFVDGAALSTFGGGQQIGYIARAHVVVGSHPIKNSGLGLGSYWTGMYSRVNSPLDETLSVGQAVNTSSTETVETWTVGGPAPGPLTFTYLTTYTLSPYPVSSDSLYQLAPSAGGINGAIYISDFGYSGGYVLVSGANGGAVTTYNPVGDTTGVTTFPAGQY